MNSIHPTKVIIAVTAALVAPLVAWFCAAVGKYGVHLDPSGVNAMAVAGIAAIVGLGAKLVHDVEVKHPQVAREVQTAEDVLRQQIRQAGMDPVA